MNYYFNKNKIVAFTKEITIEFDNPYEGIEKDFCIDENGYQLLNAIKPKNISVGDSLILDKKTKIRLLNDRPSLFEDNFTNELFLDLDKLKQATQFAEVKNTNRPILQGIYVNGKGTIMATDSFKLYIYDCGDDDNSVVISKELAKELTKYDGYQLFRFNSNVAQVFIEEQNITITGRLYQGTYPKIRGIIPISGKTIKLSKEELSNHLNIGKYITGETKVCNISNKEISIYSFDSESDIYKSDIQTNDEEFSFLLNYDYLKLAISCFTNISFLVDSNDPKNKPIAIRNIDTDSEESKVVVILIPMREI